jgi:hypothetical protein
MNGCSLLRSQTFDQTETIITHRRLNPRAFHAEASLSSGITAAFTELSFQFKNQKRNVIIAYLQCDDAISFGPIIVWLNMYFGLQNVPQALA